MNQLIKFSRDIRKLVTKLLQTFNYLDWIQTK